MVSLHLRMVTVLIYVKTMQQFQEHDNKLRYFQINFYGQNVDFGRFDGLA